MFQDKLMKPKEVAEYLSLSLSQVYNLLRNNEIRHSRFGTSYRVRPEDVLAFVESNTHGAQPVASNAQKERWYIDA